jgi:hypothetical protein
MRTQASRAISELLEDDDFQQLITDRLEEDPTFWTGSGKRRTVITVALNLRRSRRRTFLCLDDVPEVPVLDEAETEWSNRQRLALAGALLALTPDDRRLCDRRYHGRWSTARLASDAGIDVAVDTVDKYLTWGEPPAQVAEKVNRVKAVADKRGRKLSFGIRLHVIVRETNAEAWKAADELIQHVTDETVASAQKIFSRMDSVGQQRMAQLHGGRRDQLEISPNLWAGVGLVRGGAGTALVGDPATVAARIREYQDVGIDTFIMSGYPHLEEAYRFAELVFPLLSLQQPNNVTPLRVNTGPFGETIANEHRPLVKASQL